MGMQSTEDFDRGEEREDRICEREREGERERMARGALMFGNPLMALRRK